MPEINKTFSSSDHVRIWCDHLTAQERLDVILFFWIIAPSLFIGDDEADEVLEKVGLFVTGGIANVLFFIFRRLLATIRRILLKAMSDLIFSTPMAKVINECIDSRLK